MVDTSKKNTIHQYKFLFTLPWILFYLIFPTWALPISVAARAVVFFGLIVYFSAAAYLMGRWFDALPVGTAAVVPLRDIMTGIRTHVWFLMVCCLALVLHIYPLFLPILIIGDEALHLTSGLWIYEHIDSAWHVFFQIAFWSPAVLVLLIRQFRKPDVSSSERCDYISELTTKGPLRRRFIFLLLLSSVAYFLLLRNITYYPEFIRYPHLIKLLYHIAYSAFGFTHVGPRIIQLLFYIFSAVYLYRTILLFSNREAALAGATIFLFLPVSFAYAQLAEISCGTLFFATLISFHFLRFIKLEDNRDLFLTSFFIGTGFMYRPEILLMFFICSGYLIVRDIANRNLNIINHFKVMLMSLAPIIPWMIIGKFYNWRNYEIIWSNFKPFEGKVFSFFLQIPQDISWVLFVMFLFSVAYLLIFKRDTLSLYFGFYFIAYYFFLALDIANYSPRLAMTYYPSMAVYLSLFLSSIIEKIKWRHSFKVSYMILSVCLISICTVPTLKAQFLSSLEFIKLKYFPSDEAMKWVKENVKEGEKILTLRIMSSDFYRIKYGIDKNRIISFWYEIDNVSTPDRLKAFCREHDVSYIMFPYNSAYIEEISPSLNIAEYLKNTREKELVEVARYYLDENSIYIYRFHDS
ncbi:MAG: glycosyltransferase family 39 protein [Nitrospirae bacterium]|nr:glycosyltransferase family 39 protein [Nitrospirota bacterium]